MCGWFETELTYHLSFFLSPSAFGNYGDILKEISYSPLMAENLSFLQSKSAAYMWETQGKISFADENFAREIMQLFSVGLYLLNIDGTLKLDENGQPLLVYTNDDIMSFSRIWTGFDYQQARGNVEEGESIQDTINIHIFFIVLQMNRHFTSSYLHDLSIVDWQSSRSNEDSSILA